jgi:hypothetical protein
MSSFAPFFSQPARRDDTKVTQNAASSLWDRLTARIAKQAAGSCELVLARNCIWELQASTSVTRYSVEPLFAPLLSNPTAMFNLEFSVPLLFRVFTHFDPSLPPPPPKEAKLIGAGAHVPPYHVLFGEFESR